jgi:transposase
MTVAISTTEAPSYDALFVENRHLRHEVKHLADDNAYLEELVRHLKRLHFAPKSEIYAAGQGTLFNEAEALAGAASAAAEDPKKPKPNRGRPVREALPENLPRIVRVIDLADADKVCPHGIALTKIGEEVTEQLDVQPLRFFVLKTVRPTYAACDCAECKAKSESPTADEATAPLLIKTAPLDAQPIPKSMASPGLLAHIAVSKYGDALPLYRQEDMFGRQGIHLPRSTQASWMIHCGEIIMPLINLAKDELLLAPVIIADETRVQVLKGTGKKPTAQNYMWVFMRDDEDGPKIVIYELGPSRSHEVPLKFLEGYAGYLLADGYEAYETLAAKMPLIILVGDWVHARRKFDEAIKAHPSDSKDEIKAKVGMALINQLFKIEREMGKVSPAERHKVRQEKCRPIVLALKAWADEVAPTVPPKTLTGKALRYMLERWPKLVLFLDDPVLRLDTNPVENAIRPFVVGRKNWLFSDTLAGAQASAALYSLIIMAKKNGLEPYAYLKAVFTELPKAKTADEVAGLLPWRWKPPGPKPAADIQQTPAN